MRRLVPGAVVSAVLLTVVIFASAVYMPILIESAARRYGLIGIACRCRAGCSRSLS